MLNDAQLTRLNDQIALEAYSSRLYLSMAFWAHSQRLPGVAAFFTNHHEHEEEHMHRLMDYIVQTGGRVVVGGVDEPPQEFKSITEAFDLALKHEQSISSSINALVDAFLEEKDHATYNFLQWYVSEQHEEEALFQGIIDSIELIGEDGRGRFWIDKEVRKNIGASGVENNQ